MSEVEMSPMRDKRQTNKQTVNIELLSQWMIEAEFRNIMNILIMILRLILPGVMREELIELLLGAHDVMFRGLQYTIHMT